MISSMSRTINKRDQNNSRKRATIANVCASTPKNAATNLCSISLSEIDTASSSSGGRRNLQLQIQELANKNKRFTKRKKREDTKWRIKDISDSEWNAKQKQLINESLKEKRKKSLKSKKKAVERKRISKGTDSEWETESEKSINELSTSLQGSILNDDERIKLFEDPCTPEKTRDMPSAYEEILHTYESPIIGFSRKKSHPISNPCTPEKTRDIPNAYEETLYTHESPVISSSRKKLHLISKKNDISQDTLLPINLLLVEVRNLEETDENETIFYYESNIKTYVPSRKPEKSLKPENFSLPVQFPTTTNSLRRDQFVKTYPEMTSRRLVSSFATSSKSMDFMEKIPNNPKKRENSPIPPGMTCVSGYWNQTLQKWKTHRESSSQNEFKSGKRKVKASKRNTKKFVRKQKCDVYDVYAADEVDSEFETGGKRMSFREFCHKQKKGG